MRRSHLCCQSLAAERHSVNKERPDGNVRPAAEDTSTGRDPAAGHHGPVGRGQHGGRVVVQLDHRGGTVRKFARTPQLIAVTAIQSAS